MRARRGLRERKQRREQRREARETRGESSPHERSRGWLSLARQQTSQADPAFVRLALFGAGTAYCVCDRSALAPYAHLSQTT